jgi:hypothetical protein
MDKRAQTAFHITHSASADACSLRELLLRQAGCAAEALQHGADSLVDVTQIGDSNGD